MDVELLKMGIKWARAEWEVNEHNGDWDQHTWYNELLPETVASLERQGVQTCGTHMCLAGWIVHQAGLNVTNTFGEIEWDETVLGRRGNHDSDVPDAAAKLLGVEVQDAFPLWSASNSIEDLEQKAAWLAEQYGEEW